VGSLWRHNTRWGPPGGRGFCALAPFNPPGPGVGRPCGGVEYAYTALPFAPDLKNK